MMGNFRLLAGNHEFLHLRRYSRAATDALCLFDRVSTGVHVRTCNTV